MTIVAMFVSMVTGCVVMLLVLAHLRDKHTAGKRKELHRKSRRSRPEKLKTYSGKL